MRGAQVEQSPLLRLFERPTGLIAHVGADGNVRLVDQKGGHAVELTQDASSGPDHQVSYGLPTWSPDGGRVAYPGYRVDAQGVTAWIAFTDRSGGRSRRAYTSTDLRPIYLSWSPDSLRIAILSTATTRGTLELGVASAEAEDDYRPLDTGQPYYWDWLPDNRTLAVHVGAERLSLLAVDGAGGAQALPTTGPFQSPDVSPDGSSLAYVRGGSDGFSLILRGLDTSVERNLTSGPRPLYFSFSADSRWVAVLGAEGVSPLPHGSLEVYGALPGDTRAQTVARDPVLAFFWSPGGDRIAFLTAAEDPGVTDAMFLRSDQLLYVALRAFELRSGKSWTITQYPATVGLLQILPFFDQYLRSITVWSPDGRNIVFTAYSADGSPSVYVVPSDGNVKPRRVAAGDTATWSPR